MFDQVTMDVLMHSATPSKTAPDRSSVLKVNQTAVLLSTAAANQDFNRSSADYCHFKATSSNCLFMPRGKSPEITNKEQQILTFKKLEPKLLLQTDNYSIIKIVD